MRLLFFNGMTISELDVLCYEFYIIYSFTRYFTPGIYMVNLYSYISRYNSAPIIVNDYEILVDLFEKFVVLCIYKVLQILIRFNYLDLNVISELIGG